MEKHEVYFNEFNVLMDDTIYLPYTAGLLQTYAMTIPEISGYYRFMPFHFMRAAPEDILPGFRNPSVAAFSASMWNRNLSLEIARRVKDRHPRCLIVLGGPEVPHQAADFFREHPFVDVTVRGEGERAFAEILIAFRRGRDFDGIPGISWRNASGECVRNAEEQVLPEDLDLYPSPYTSGVYDHLFEQYPQVKFQAIIETNRGCPYLCSYCSWGQGGLSKKYRFFSLDRIRRDVEWFAQRKLLYIFCADSNFGAFDRDLEIARLLVQAKVKYGFPEKFRVCYSKNAQDRIFEIGKLFHGQDLQKGITLSLQTVCREAAINVGRRNIRFDTFKDLQQMFTRAGVPVYTELILGLPGETCQSFKEGLEEILVSLKRNQLFVYFCQVYPNTEMDEPDYQSRHRITTMRIPLAEIHAVVRPAGMAQEYENIIVSTATMTRDDWRTMAMLSWLVKLMHGMKVGFFVLSYLVDRFGWRFLDLPEALLAKRCSGEKPRVLAGLVDGMGSIADSILAGNPSAQVRPEFGLIYWDVEEALFLDIVGRKEAFYGELRSLVERLMVDRGIGFDAEELREAFNYQQAVIPDLSLSDSDPVDFSFNIPEYFEALSGGVPVPLIRKPQRLIFARGNDYGGDKKAFARDVVVWGRKSNRITVPVSWHDLRPGIPEEGP